MGHPDIIFRQYIQISWNHNEVWIRAFLVGLQIHLGLDLFGWKKCSTVYLSPGPGVWCFFYKSFRLLAGYSGVTKRASIGVHGAVAGEISCGVFQLS